MLILLLRIGTAAVRLVSTAIVLTVVVFLVGTAPSTAASTVLSFGLNGGGRTGQNASSGETLIATPIDDTNLMHKSVVQVGAGAIHSLLLADDGTVYSFGNNRFGATGLNTDVGLTLATTPIDTANLAEKRIKEMAVGANHNLLLADDGTVVSFGQNQFGATGQNTSTGNTLSATPIDVSNLAGKTITQMDASRSHSLLLADDGTVFSFGRNTNGRTGLNTDLDDTLVATPIDMTNLSGKSIVQVAAGEWHSLLLAEDGSVFSFGDNSFGQTGLNLTSGNTLIATLIDTSNLAGKKITSVSAGERHSLLLADDGTVISFGDNSLRTTGLNLTEGVTPIATPIDTTNLSGTTIAQIDAGRFHSLLLTNEGKVFAFGQNMSGETGQSIAQAVAIDSTNLVGARARVTDIAGGSFFSLLIAVPEPSSWFVALVAGMLPREVCWRDPRIFVRH